jgi:hypothetical protein
MAAPEEVLNGTLLEQALAVTMTPGPQLIGRRDLTLSLDPPVVELVAGAKVLLHLDVEGGEWPFTFGVEQGRLPDGLHLGTGSGVLVGSVPYATTESALLNVVDHAGERATCLVKFEVE